VGDDIDSFVLKVLSLLRAIFLHITEHGVFSSVHEGRVDFIFVVFDFFDSAGGFARWGLNTFSFP